MLQGIKDSHSENISCAGNAPAPFPSNIWVKVKMTVFKMVTFLCESSADGLYLCLCGYS